MNDNTGKSGIGQRIACGAEPVMPLKLEKYLKKYSISEALENGISEIGVMPIDGGVVVSYKVFLEEGICKPRCRGEKAGKGGNSDSLVSESNCLGEGALRMRKVSEFRKP